MNLWTKASQFLSDPVFYASEYQIMASAPVFRVNTTLVFQKFDSVLYINTEPRLMNFLQLLSRR